ncbi:MAG: para-aminobenzoate synthetase component 2 [Pontimonas sp.]
MTHILVVDNYDSFVYTLNGYLHQLGATTDVIRNDDVAVPDIATLISGYDGILVSPGPGTPADAGMSIAVVHEALTQKVPLLGVCLGHQAIAEAFGATVAHADELMHGKTSQVHHDDSRLFEGVPEEFRATRYHSLAVVEGTVPDDLAITARTSEGVIMGLHHRSAPIYGVQFHPESVLTEGGYTMIANWLEVAGLTGASERAKGLSPRVVKA